MIFKNLILGVLLQLLTIVPAGATELTAIDAISRAQKSIQDLLENQQLRREKRQSNAVQCIETCTTQLTTGLGSEFSESSSGMVNPQFFDPNKFNQFCSVYISGKNCIDRCSYSTLKQTIEIMFKPLDYLCIEHRQDFLTHTSCFQQSQNEVESTCNPRCGDASSLRSLKNRQTQAQQRGDMNTVKQTLSEMCKYVSCHLSCTSPILTKSCGGEAPAAFLIDFAKTSFEQSENALRRAGAMQYWPDNCADVARGRISSAANTQINHNHRGLTLVLVLCTLFCVSWLQ